MTVGVSVSMTERLFVALYVLIHGRAVGSSAITEATAHWRSMEAYWKGRGR